LTGWQGRSAFAVRRPVSVAFASLFARPGRRAWRGDQPN